MQRLIRWWVFSIQNIVAPITNSEFSKYEDIDPSKLEENQRNAVNLAKNIADAIECGTFEMKVIKKLEAINTYECPSPYAIAKSFSQSSMKILAGVVQYMQTSELLWLGSRENSFLFTS